MMEVVFNYFKSILFIILFIIYLNLIGSALDKSNSRFSKKIIIGYIIHSSIVGCFGILVQILKLDWWIFAVLNGLTILFLLLISLFILRREKRIDLFFSHVRKNLFLHLKNYWFMYFVTFVLLGMSVIYINMHIYNNHLDDGLYLMRIAQLPYLDNPFSTVYATGFLNEETLSLSNLAYSFNVFDLEASVYSYVFSIPPTLFARFVLNYINYFLFSNSILWLVDELFSEDKFKLSLRPMCLSILIFFGFYDLWMRDYLYLINDFLFNAGMWYGSSIVRCCGLFILLIPLLKKTEVKDLIIYFTLASMTLLSKSSIAVPLIFVGFILYAVKISIQCNKRLLLIPVCILMVLSVFVLLDIGVPSNEWNEIVHGQDSQSLEVIYTQMYSTIEINFKYPIFWMTIVIYALSFFVIKEDVLRRWNYILLGVIILMFIPIVNYPFIKLSVYNFVALRMITLLFYTMIVTSYIYLCYIVYKYFSECLFKISWGCFSVILCITFFGHYHSSFSIRNSLSYLKNNPYLFPTSTLKLSERLDELTKSMDEPLCILTNELISIYGATHPLATSLRINSFDIYSVSAIPRFGAGGNLEFKEFTQEDQDVYNRFSFEPEKSYGEMKEMLARYPSINCFVTISDNVGTYLSEMGFQAEVLNTKELTYYIYLKK